MDSIRLTVPVEETAHLTFSEQPGFGLGLGEPYVDRQLPDYTGETTVTPSTAVQTLETAGRSLRSDIVVSPIPSNYGLVSWNGSVLTVS